MARIETTTRTLYPFDELSDKAKERALEKQAEFEGEVFDAADSYEDFENIAKILGITFEQRAVLLRNGKKLFEPCISYSGFWSQGDGASYEGSYAYRKGCSKLIRAYAPTDTKLHRIADELTVLQKPFMYGLEATITTRGNYSHSGTMQVEVTHVRDNERSSSNWTDVSKVEEPLTQLLRDFADWMYRQLEKEYEYRTSEEACKESIEANEYEFDEKGNLA